MICDDCRSAFLEPIMLQVAIGPHGLLPSCPNCGSLRIRKDACESTLPIICRNCQSQLDGSCKYSGEPIRYYNSPENFCKTHKPAIADSGHRTEFATGAVRDMHEGKGRYDLLPWDAIHELAIHCEQGAKKYGERNCEKGIPVHSLIDSAIRHLSCYLRGMKDEPHLRAALWNVAFAIWMEKNRPEQQDIPTRSEAK